jgi:hypothetical protein
MKYDAATYVHVKNGLPQVFWAVEKLEYVHQVTRILLLRGLVHHCGKFTIWELQVTSEYFLNKPLSPYILYCRRIF